MQAISFQNVQTAYTTNNKKHTHTQKKNNKKMDRILKQTFLQRRHTDGQWAHEKMLNITKNRRNANQNYNDISSHTSGYWCNHYREQYGGSLKY